MGSKDRENGGTGIRGQRKGWMICKGHNSGEEGSRKRGFRLYVGHLLRMAVHMVTEPFTDCLHLEADVLQRAVIQNETAIKHKCWFEHRFVDSLVIVALK